MSESETPAPESRTPRLRWMLLTLALGGLLLQLAIGRVKLPVSLAGAMDEVQTSEGVDVVILGTCLAEQELDERRIAAAWGGGAVHGLGTAGTGPMDWALAVRNRMPAGVEHVVVAFVTGDLQNALAPWESRTPELMRLRDLPEVWETCDAGGAVADKANSPEIEPRLRCRIELTLLRGWPAYRYRGFVSATVWKWWGAEAQAAQSTIGGQPLPAQSARTAPAQPSAAEALKWTGRLIEASKAAGATVTFMQMPVRRDANQDFASGDPAFQDLGRFLRERGAGYTALPTVPAKDFEDDRHVKPEGSEILSDSIGAWMREAWKAG